jgi:hypothetical protein
MIEAAASDDPSNRQRALNEFAHCYRRPCEEWLRKNGWSFEHAEEAVQSFLVEVVLERGLLGAARPAQGSLRRLVQHALRNHAIDLHRRSAARDRHELRATASNSGQDDEKSASEIDAAFDALWARAQLTAAIERVRNRLVGTPNERAWHAFELRILLPAVHATRVPSYEEVARTAGIAGAARATVLVREIRMKVLRALQEVVSETARNPEDVETELRHVNACLERRGR